MSRSVLAVKGSLRRFAPWTAPGRSGEKRCFTREKGGTAGSGVHDPDELAHDTWIISISHGLAKPLKGTVPGHTRLSLSRSSGALTA